MVYLNPGGHNWGPKNYDGYGLSTVAVAVVYSVAFYAACLYVWLNRHHPILRMRKINLSILSMLILHVYLFMIFMVYFLNGAFPCGVEFWTMSIYLPLGIGLFQAQNQQLLIVSQEQSQLLSTNECYKPLLPKGSGFGGLKYWMFRFKVWWKTSSRQGKYEGFVFAGVCVQALVSLIIYCMSRKFNSYGIVSHPVSPGQCRRGWEWIPSIIWQFLWNFFFGPYLLWKIRMIHDIYHWRLQTILAVVAGLPGTPLWLVGVYSNGFTSVNRYWVPAMWFVPGLVTMEITALVFPIVQMYKHKNSARETEKVLAEFDTKVLNGTNPKGSIITGIDSVTSSQMTPSLGSKGSGKMYSMDSLDDCLMNNYDGLQIYASSMELNGENILFLVKVCAFRKHWSSTFSRTTDIVRARQVMFRTALSLYMSLVNNDTAIYPINIESSVYQKLATIFGPATKLAATKRSNSIVSATNTATPWDEPPAPDYFDTSVSQHHNTSEIIQMKAMVSTPPIRLSSSNDSSECIISSTEVPSSTDPLAGFAVPMSFDEHVFDAAYKSIRYMVWTETWQRYCLWKRNSDCSV